MGQEIKESGGKEKIEISQEAIDLIRGLKRMGDLEGCFHLLEHLEILSRFIDEIDEGNLFFWGEDKIMAIAYWQRKIIKEIRHILEGQDRIIMKLQSPIEMTPKMETVKVDSRKLEALRHLASLFCADGLIYTDKAGLSALKAWTITHGYNFEMVKDLLGERKAPETGTS